VGVMSDQQIKRIIRNVNKTLAVEGLQISEKNRIYGKRFIKGEMSSEEVISLITKDILDRKNKLEQ
jgi:hypothetical protein